MPEFQNNETAAPSRRLNNPNSREVNCDSRPQIYLHGEHRLLIASPDLKQPDAARLFSSNVKNDIPASFTSCTPPKIRWFQSLPTSASIRGVCSDATRCSASTIAMLVLHKHDQNYDIITRKKQLEQVALNMRTNPAMKKPKKKMANTCRKAPTWRYSSHACTMSSPPCKVFLSSLSAAPSQTG